MTLDTMQGWDGTQSTKLVPMDARAAVRKVGIEWDGSARVEVGELGCRRALTTFT